MKPLTVQVNLSPGDVDYAALTVPALLAAHPGAAERLLVVDLCRPQRTAIVDPARRFPEPEFGRRCERIAALAHQFLQEGRVDRVEVLRPGDARFPEWRRAYLRPWLRETHDYGGCALLAYVAAFALCRTRWLVHYDADMLVAHPTGEDWAESAASWIDEDGRLVAASPRPSPPPPDADAPTRHERLPLLGHPAGWLNQWFSTRCFLFDCWRLAPALPLVQGRTLWETILARLRGRGYPRSPETLLFRRMHACDRWRLTLGRRDVWLLHPTRKDAAWQAALPAIRNAVAAGRYPPAQGGFADLQMDAWQIFLGGSS